MSHGGRVARRTALALGAGLLLYANHPPLDWSPAGFLALAPLSALARSVDGDRHPARTGFGWGVVAGLTFFLPLLTWIGRFGVAPWLLLSTVQALFVGAAVAVLAAWGRRPGRALVAVAAWVAFEALRSTWPLSGFPWGVLAYGQHDGGALLPLARVLGALGVSAGLATVGVAVESGLAAAVAGRWGRAAAAAMAAAAVFVLAVLVPAPPPPTGGTVDVAAVQGNDVELPPFVDRGNVARVRDIADRMVATTQRLPPDDPPDVVVWPENAIDGDPRTNPQLAQAVKRAQAAAPGATLLAGTLLEGDAPATFTNSIVRYGRGASVEEVYDKRVVVPFGEYVPWRSVLGRLPPLRAIPSDAVPGDEPHVFDVGGALIGPVTCFESIYPNLVRDQVRAGAQVLVVSTNNASFGRTPASAQHLAFSQVRAVETGRWVLHAGISGISAVVDRHGALSQRTGLFERAIVRADLPLVDEPTLFVRTGDLVGPLSVLTMLLALVWIAATRRPARD